MKLHPLNQQFSWQPPPSSLSYLNAEQVRAYNEQGGFVLPDVFSAAEVADLLSELDPLKQNVTPTCRALIQPANDRQT